MRKIFSLILFATLLLQAERASAKHIVGGEITYKYVSTTGNIVRLAFTMKIYRDCFSTGAQLDQLAVIGIFAKGGGLALPAFTVPLQSVTQVAAPTYPCLIPPQVCVEEGLYVWQSDLPINATGYVVEYQRCCRNETITNIYTPGDVGATYSVEITPLALQTANNSPDFKSFPPTIVCAEQNLNFDHSAIDKEGDQIVYRFCQPSGGGGKGMARDCNATAPNPPCYPPGGLDIQFKVPDYTVNTPLGGNPIVRIDPNTGLITGKPIVQGQFVVGVCAEEYRNGKLLTVLQRDFQFNVADCKPTIAAKVKADTVINKNYIISTCGVQSLTITNQSFERKNVSVSYYEIQIGQELKRFTDWEPTINFPDTGVYTGNFYINPNTQCGDTISLTFNVFSSAKSNFSFKYDTCVAGPVAFTDKSISINGGIKKWTWDFGDNSNSSLKNPTHLYATPGTKNIQLRVEDGRLCKSDTTININWQPAPATIVVEPSSFNGCTPLSVFYNNLSKPIDSTYKVKWTFTDGTTSTSISPTKIYDKPGDFSAKIEITSPIGCYITKSFQSVAKVRQGAKADFDYSPTQVTSFNNTVSFTDKSQNASQWYWYFNQKGFSSSRNPTYTFRDTGIQQVKLVAANQFNCTDTLIKFLDVVPQVTYFLPNAFTPNNDNVNDFYKGAGITEGIQQFKMSIWNRWGELIYQTDNPVLGWNGRKYNSGEDEPQGVYLCVVNYYTPRGEYKEIRSFATLIR